MSGPSVELRIKTPEGPTVVCTWPSWAQVPDDVKAVVRKQMRERWPDKAHTIP
jgi:hypothetical protein